MCMHVEITPSRLSNMDTNKDTFDEEGMFLCELLQNIDRKKRKFEEENTNYKTMLATLFTAAAHEFETDPAPRTPWNAQPHKRLEVKLKMMTMGERLFKRNYRLDRNNFMNLLRQITPLIEFQGNNSSHECGDGCDLHIDPYIQLAVALRLLAGGSYLDITFA